MEFDYTVTTEKSFDEAVAAVEQETKKAGFRVLYIHDVAATLKEKGFEIDRKNIKSIYRNTANIFWNTLVIFILGK